MSENPKVLVCTLLCDRKKFSQTSAPPALFNLTYPNIGFYFNVQTDDFDGNFEYLKDLIKENEDKVVHVDTWNFKSSWWKAPTFDQDQARLVPICTARNMCIDCALLQGYDYIFFVDADVVVPPDSIERLITQNRPIVSGLVPGRGAHKAAVYAFHFIGQPKPEVWNCEHSTCGFTLLKREVFEVLRFRQGPHPIHRETWLSEDPSYGADMKCIWAISDGWWVDASLKADHVDDPLNPLTMDGGSQF